MKSFCVNDEKGSKKEGLVGSQKQPEPHKIVVDSTPHHFDGALRIRFCSMDLQDTQLIYPDASIVMRGDLFSQSLAVFLASLDTTSGTAAVINLLTIIQDLAFFAHLLNCQAKSIACCENISARIVEKHNPYCDVHCIFIHSSSIGSIFMVKEELFLRQ